MVFRYAWASTRRSLKRVTRQIGPRCLRSLQRINPKTYLLEDYRGKSIVGAFYEYELHRATHPNIYLVEKVLRRRGNEVYVKWLGFDGSHNSWIHKMHCEKIYYKLIIYFYPYKKHIIQTYYKYIQNKFLLQIHNCILIFYYKI